MIMKLRSSKNKIAKVNKIAKRNVVKKTFVKTHINLIKTAERYNDELKIFKILIDFKNQMELELKRTEEMKTIKMVDFDNMSFVCPELEYLNAQF